MSSGKCLESQPEGIDVNCFVVPKSSQKRPGGDKVVSLKSSTVSKDCDTDVYFKSTSVSNDC